MVMKYYISHFLYYKFYIIKNIKGNEKLKKI